MADFGRLLILLGIVFLILGGLVVVIGKVSFWGKLPGDIVFQQGNGSCFIPLATSILLSLALTVLLNVILRVLNR